MSDKSDDHGATTVHASKGGGGMKWLLGAAAAVILVGGGYLAWKNYGQNPDQTQTAYNDGYSDTYADDTPSRAGPLAEEAEDGAQIRVYGGHYLQVFHARRVAEVIRGVLP